MSYPNNSLPLFTGNRLDWPMFFELFRNLSKSFRPTITPWGLLPFLFATGHPLLATLVGLTLPLVIPVNPGDPPAFDPQLDANDTAVFNASLKSWEIRMARYTTFCTGSTILLQYLFDVLPAATIKALRHPSHGLTLHTLESATTALLALYDTFTPEDISELRQQCLKPYVSSECMRTYTATHTTIHDTCANNKQPYPEQDKIDN